MLRYGLARVDFQPDPRPAARYRAASALSDRIEIQEPGVDFRHDAAQSSLPLDERQSADVLTVHGEHVERVKVRVIPPEQRPVEVASSGGLQG